MISAKIIAYSAYESKEIITFELEYPRYIHAELLTHRVFSRNAASSRAIPIAKLIEQVEENTVMPIWTYNEAGMQGEIVANGRDKHKANAIWLQGAKHAMECASALSAAGIHKQNANRVLEPFQHIKTILTAAQLSNFFALRNHSDAQPEIRTLAREMLLEMKLATPTQLFMGDWHLPYVLSTDIDTLTPAECKRISSSCCAQVSYRRNDPSLQKADFIYDKLVNGKPAHYSPFEHQCTPNIKGETQKGNLYGFHQLRSDIEEGIY